MVTHDELRIIYDRIFTAQDLGSSVLDLSETNIDSETLEMVKPLIKGLSSLIHLDVSRNRISQIPEWLVNLPAIQRLNFSNNPLSDEAVNSLNKMGKRQRIVINTNRNEIDTDHDYKANLKDFYSMISRAKIKDKLRACDLEPVDIIYEGKKDPQLKLARAVIKEFMSKVPMDNKYEKKVYGNTFKRQLDFLLDKTIPKDVRQLRLVGMGIALGNCATPVRTYLEQMMVMHLLETGAELSPENELMIERIALMKKVEKLPGLTFGENIEAVNGLINEVYSRDWVVTAYKKENRRRNLEIPRGIFEEVRVRNLPPMSGNVSYDNSLIHHNPELIKQFIGLIGKRKDGRLGRYNVDYEELKKQKKAYLSELGFKTEDSKVREKYFKQYLEDIQEFIETHEMTDLLFIDHSDEAVAKGLVQFPKHQEVLKGLLVGDMKKEYERFLAQQQTKLIDFRDDMERKDYVGRYQEDMKSFAALKGVAIDLPQQEKELKRLLENKKGSDIKQEFERFVAEQQTKLTDSQGHLNGPEHHMAHSTSPVNNSKRRNRGASSAAVNNNQHPSVTLRHRRDSYSAAMDNDERPLQAPAQNVMANSDDQRPPVAPRHHRDSYSAAMDSNWPPQIPAQNRRDRFTVALNEAQHRPLTARPARTHGDTGGQQESRGRRL